MTEASIELGGDGCARLSGALTFRSIPALYAEAEPLMRADSGVDSIDLAGVDAADSAGLALLLEWQAVRPAGAGKLAIRNAPPSLLSLARLCEADGLLDLSGRGP